MASDELPTKTTNTLNDMSAAEVEHFSSLPLARPILDDPLFSIYPKSRTTQQNERQHTLMAQTWNTPDTIAHTLTLTKTTPSEILQFVRFYTFGSGLNAHLDRLHGGVMAAILDSTLSNAAHMALQQISQDGSSVATVQLNIRYQKPVSTPGSVMIVARVSRVEAGGRKIWVEGSVRSGDDGEISHATAEGLWLKIPLPGGKL